MKFFFLFLFSLNALAGFPPTSLKGQSQATATTTFSFQVPNNQATKTATGSLIETGSQNLLSNPGFEHSTVGTSWNVTNGTLTASSSAPFGNFYGSFTGSVANGNIQSTTGSGTAQAGLNCLVSAYVKTASSNVQLCAIHNGTLNTNLCVSVNPSNTWAQYQVPTVCDATSTVARVRITTSVSTTFHVDNVYVGVNPNFGSVAQAQIAGKSYFQSTTSCLWTRANTAIGSFGAVAACPGPTNIQTNLGAWASTDSNLPRQTITNLPPGKYIAVFKGVQSTSGNEGVLTISDGTTTCSSSRVGNVSSTYDQFETSCIFEYQSSQSSVSFELVANARTNTMQLANDYSVATTGSGLQFELYYYPPSSSIVTTNNQDYDWTAYTPTSPNGSFGSLAATECFHKRNGSDLLVNCKFTTGTVAASEARISLPTGLTSASSSIIPSIRLNGYWVYTSGAASLSGAILIEPAVNYFTFGYQTSSTGGGTKQNANGFGSGISLSFFARIPIQGWNNNNVIVGTFAGVNSTPSIANPKIFSAKVSSTGTVTDDLGDFINGNCTNASPSVCTFNSVFSITPNCMINAFGAVGGANSARVENITAQSSSSISLYFVNDGGAAFQSAFNIICHGY
jgi:hypothetical protein